MRWRDVGRLWRAKYVETATKAIERRLAFGIEEYGDRFQGDPLEHAIEEVLDLLFFLEVLSAQREDLCYDCKVRLGLD